MNIYDYTIKQLEDYFISKGEKKFKAVQVFEWLYQKRVKSFDEMTNIKKDFKINSLEILTKQEDVDVIKYLFKLEDNNKIEAV